jgi:hypothetical protein
MDAAQTENNPNQDSAPHSPVVPTSEPDVANEVNPTTTENTSHNSVNNEPMEGQESRHKTPWTDKGSFWINVVLAIGTWAVFWLALRQTNVAESAIARADSANAISKASLEYARWKDSTDRVESKISDSLNDARLDSSLGIGQKNADAATKSANALKLSIDESKRQFSIINSPYLQFSGMNFENYGTKKPIHLSVEIANIGKYPARVIGGKWVASTRVTPPDFKSVYKTGEPIKAINYYATASSPIKLSMYMEKALSINQFEKLEAKEFFFYFWGYIEYINLSDNTKKVYKFFLRTVPSTMEGDFIINDNEQLKK